MIPSGWLWASVLASPCYPHRCSLCGAEVDNLTSHGLSCSEGRHPRHSALNNIIHCSLSSAHIPSRREPSAIYRSEWKHPDGISLVPWKQEKVLVWDVTCPDTFAPSHLSSAAMSSGAMVQQVENRPRGLSTDIWMQVTTLSWWLWRYQECWVQRPSNCSGTSDTASGRQLGNKGPISFSSSECPWLCEVGTGWLLWDLSGTWT